MNRFQFLGRLTRDPETKITSSATLVTTFDLAVNRKYNNEQVNADFFKITAFGKLAEVISKHFNKGQQVLVEGRIQNTNWEDEKGNKRYGTEYILETFYFADSKRESSNEGFVADDDGYVTVDETQELPF